MPYPHEHAARLQNPAKFAKFRRDDGKFGPGIDAIWGITKTGEIELQSIRFDAARFTAAQARKWCTDHKVKTILFVPAGPMKAAMDMDREAPEALELLAAVDLNIEASGADGKPRLPTFNMLAYTGRPMQLNGWHNPVVIDLSGLTIPRQTLPIKEEHGPRIGHTDKIAVMGSQLVASGVLSCSGPNAQQVIQDAKNGFPWQASVGARVDSFEFIRPDQTARANGQTFKGPVNIARKTTLGEISFVGIGADTNTVVRVAANGARNRGKE